MALAVVPASLATVLLIMGGITIWSGLAGMFNNFGSSGADGTEVIAAIIFELGSTLLFPVWGVALAVATLGYYYRRRGLCSVWSWHIRRGCEPALSVQQVIPGVDTALT